MQMRDELAAVGHAADPRYSLPDAALRDERRRVRGILAVKKPFPSCFVAYAPAGLVGFVWIQASGLPPYARIQELFVTPHARRTGVGRVLVETAVQAAEAAGYGHIEVSTLAKDGRAVAFWRSMGFGDWWVTLRRDPPA